MAACYLPSPGPTTAHGGDRGQHYHGDCRVPTPPCPIEAKEATEWAKSGEAEPEAEEEEQQD